MQLDILEIRILLKCNEMPLTRTHIAHLYAKYSKQERDQALIHLTSKNLINIKRLPKPGVTKTPTFYEITDQGKSWIKEYLENYPS